MDFFNDPNSYEKYLKEKKEFDALDEEEKILENEKLEKELEERSKEYEEKLEHMRQQKPKAERFVNRKISRKKKSTF